LFIFLGKKKKKKLTIAVSIANLISFTIDQVSSPAHTNNSKYPSKINIPSWSRSLEQKFSISSAYFILFILFYFILLSKKGEKKRNIKVFFSKKKN